MARYRDKLLIHAVYGFMDRHARSLRDLPIYNGRELVEYNEIALQHCSRQFDAHLFPVR